MRCCLGLELIRCRYHSFSGTMLVFTETSYKLEEGKAMASLT